MSYTDDLASAVPDLQTYLSDKGVDDEKLSFGGAGEETTVNPRIPTDANSNFLANRAMGDWAEDILSDALNEQERDIKAVAYGDSDRLSAGEDGFKEFYLNKLEDVRLNGKRPDLLLFPKEFKVNEDLSDKSHNELATVVPSAIGSIEVRSSKFEAETYMAVRQQELEEGKKPSRLTPSFTVKVEDLKIVYRWIEKFNLPQIYCQVFFDSIYAIDIIDIFRTIPSDKSVKIETPAKSQLKSTILIPITFGIKIANITEPPRYDVEETVSRLGRHDAYVKPVGGKVELDSSKIKEAISNWN